MFDTVMVLLVIHVLWAVSGLTVSLCVADSVSYFLCDVQGSFRRCGGQGDMLSGILAAFAGWVSVRKFTNYPPLKENISDTVLACFSASYITRSCNRMAFKKYSRSMLVTDMLKELPAVFVPFCEGQASQ